MKSTFGRPETPVPRLHTAMPQSIHTCQAEMEFITADAFLGLAGQHRQRSHRCSSLPLCALGNWIPYWKAVGEDRFRLLPSTRERDVRGGRAATASRATKVG
jgi:hypothetical protein